MQGDPQVIEALNAAYKVGKAIEEQTHLQEHLYESKGWPFERWFHEIEEDGHRLVIHKLMNRVNRLGGRLTPGYAFDPVVFEAEQIDRACDETRSRLDQWRASLRAVCNAAEVADDYVTIKKVWKWLCWIEARIADFENRLAMIQVNGVKAFLQEKMG